MKLHLRHHNDKKAVTNGDQDDHVAAITATLGMHMGNPLTTLELPIFLSDKRCV